MRQWFYTVFNTESEAKLLYAATIGWKWSIKNKVYYSATYTTRGSLNLVMSNDTMSWVMTQQANISLIFWRQREVQDVEDRTHIA